MRGNSGDVYCSGGDVDEEQDIVSDKAFDRIYLDAQKIRRRQTRPVSLQKRRPSGVCVAFGCGLDPALLQDVCDCATSDLMPEICECATDSRVSPRRILKRHTHNEIHNGLHEARPARTAPMAVVPLGC